MSLRDVDQRLRDARPADPAGQDLRAASVRVIARLAMLESGAQAAATEVVRPRRVRLVPIAAAAACLAFLSLDASRVFETHRAPPAVVPTTPVSSGLAAQAEAKQAEAKQAEATQIEAARIEAALAGDVLARRRLLAAGPRMRAALIDHAVDSPATAGAALALLSASGGLRDDLEASRIALLVTDPAVRDAAVELLAAAPTTAGVQQLGHLLLERPEVETAVVGGLERAARHGRRTTAVGALVRGAARGRVEAAAAAIRLGSGRVALDVLAVLPRRHLGDERIARACRDAAPTTRDRLVRRAAAGDERVLGAVAAARLDGVVPMLEREALEGDASTARSAVAALARQERGEAWLALARALGGEAAAEAHALLGTMPRSGVVHLARTARTDARQRALAIQGLSLAGEAGLDALARLATRPALYGLVVDVLERAAAPAAVDVLSGLATGGHDEGRALVALSRRLENGDRRAGTALLALVEDHDSRQALRLLARYGAGAGLDWLARVAVRPSLPPAARAQLRRALRRAQIAEGGPPRTAARRPGPAPIT